jgi:enoyl-CoA hydratase/carnithine racemase
MQRQSAASSYTTIDYVDVDVPVARITLNRPDKRNPIGPLTIGELMHAFEAARENEAARVVVLTGAGSAFSAGGDLGSFSGTAEPRSPIRPRSLTELFPAMHALGKPIIAMVNGPAMGGGLGLVAACDVVVASDQATFGLPEIKVGLWPMMVMAEIARNVGRKAALELALTGRHMAAQQALALGLVTRVVPHERLEAETMDLARAVAAHSPATIALGLRAFYDCQDKDFEAGLAHLAKELDKVLALEDAKEGIMAFLQKRKPEWKGR